MYSSQSCGWAVVSWTQSTEAPSGSGTNASTTEVTAQRRTPSAASGPGTGTLRPSTRTAAGPAGSSTVHTSACRRTVASSVARPVIGSGWRASETTSVASAALPSTWTAATPA